MDFHEFKASQGRELQRRRCLKTKTKQHVEVSFETFLLPTPGEREVRKKMGSRASVLPNKWQCSPTRGPSIQLGQGGKL